MTAEREARRRYDHGGFHGGRGLVEDCVRAFVAGAEYRESGAFYTDMAEEGVRMAETCAAVTAATDDAARHLGHVHPVVLALRKALAAS